MSNYLTCSLCPGQTFAPFLHWPPKTILAPPVKSSGYGPVLLISLKPFSTQTSINSNAIFIFLNQNK